ncbi:MAG: sulfotransferase [Actinomycetota bacterium]
MIGRLPNLLIAGAPKAGTTSLFGYLAQHPDICPASDKEIRYFKPLRDEDGSLPSLDTYTKYFEHCRGERYAMEATPSYCYGGTRMLKAIRTTLDDPRVIISLRNPVDRLWSAYTFQRTKGHLKGLSSFEEYVSLCDEKYRAGDRFTPYLEGLSIGFYADYLGGWFDLFEDDVRVIFTDELFAAPERVIRSLCEWLSIDAEAASSFDYEARNKTVHAKSLTISRVAQSVKKRSNNVMAGSPALRDGLRKAYVRLNTGELAEELRPQTRRLVDGIYSESNLALAEMLKARGYERLPQWLERKLAPGGG